MTRRLRILAAALAVVLMVDAAVRIAATIAATIALRACVEPPRTGESLDDWLAGQLERIRRARGER